MSRLGKVLGPRGLMPTPKAGTVVPATGDLAAAVREFKAGKVEYRSDKTGQIHAGVGKMSFDEQKLVENINAVRRTGPRGQADRREGQLHQRGGAVRHHVAGHPALGLVGSEQQAVGGQNRLPDFLPCFLVFTAHCPPHTDYWQSQ